MPSIINASSTGSGGIVQTADASGVLQLQSNGTVALTTTGANVAIGGSAPNAWGATFKALQVGLSASLYSNDTGSGSFVGNNFYYDGASNRYINSSTASAYAQNAGQHQWFNAATGTAGNVVSFTTAMTLNPNGALALQGASTSATGVGITFPATQSASSDVNTLDDYEEGTFTPTFISSGASFSYAQQFGVYTKVGRLVVATIWIRGQASGTTSNGLSIGSLPFMSNSTTSYYGVSWGQFYFITFPSGVGNMTAYLASSSSSMNLEFSQNTTTTGSITAACLSSAVSGFIVTVSYFA